MQEMTQRREGTATQAGGDNLLRPLTTLELGYLDTWRRRHQSWASERNPLLSARSSCLSIDLRPFFLLEPRVISFSLLCCLPSFLSLWDACDKLAAIVGMPTSIDSRARSHLLLPDCCWWYPLSMYVVGISQLALLCTYFTHNDHSHIAFPFWNCRYTPE